MDNQWRPTPMPPPQATLCPVCFISHFPFCPPYPPPPPPYHPNPRFPPPPDYYPPDPYHAAEPNPYEQSPFGGWHRRPSFDHSGGFGPPMYSHGNGNSFYDNYANGEVDRSIKMPRVDDTGRSGVFGHEDNGFPARNSLDNERRLKLIRDHGGASGWGFDSTPLSGEKTAPVKSGPVIDSTAGSGSQYSGVNSWQDQQFPQVYGRFDYNGQEYQTPGRLIEGNQGLIGNRNLPGVSTYGALNSNENRVFGGQLQPPLPSPPAPAPPAPPLPMEPPLPSSPPKTSFSLFPVPIDSQVNNPYLQNKPASTSMASEEWQMSSRQFPGEGQAYMRKQLSRDNSIVVDAFQLFKKPHRATRPDRIVIILRGLPGSGKSYLAKMLRDFEVENGGDAPRIHSMDDYFMTEVEKVDENDGAKSSYGSVRSKKPAVKKVMEYCFEPEMEEAYRDSMLKAFKKTLEEGNFAFVIVDDRNLRVADFAQFWAIAKRSFYEVYILEAAYKDPAGCAARNIHGFTLDEIQKMARQREEAPSLYLQLDVKSLFRGDDLKESGIKEVDMDTEDGDLDNDLSRVPDTTIEKTIALPTENNAPQAPSKDGKKSDDEEDHATGVKELAKSKWSEDIYEDDRKGSEGVKGNVNALSGLIQAYGKRRKFVHWSDKVGNTGFSIGAAKKANMRSLVIGPGAGYNLKSNSLPEEEIAASPQTIGKSKTQSMFQERLRAERESFKAVFDRRRQRIGVLDFEEES